MSVPQHGTFKPPLRPLTASTAPPGPARPRRTQPSRWGGGSQALGCDRRSRHRPPTPCAWSPRPSTGRCGGPQENPQVAVMSIGAGAHASRPAPGPLGAPGEGRAAVAVTVTWARCVWEDAAALARGASASPRRAAEAPGVPPARSHVSLGSRLLLPRGGRDPRLSRDARPELPTAKGTGMRRSVQGRLSEVAPTRSTAASTEGESVKPRKLHVIRCCQTNGAFLCGRSLQGWWFCGFAEAEEAASRGARAARRAPLLTQGVASVGAPDACAVFPAGRAQLGDGPLLQAAPVAGDSGGGAEGLRRGADHAQVSPGRHPRRPSPQGAARAEIHHNARRRERAAHSTEAAQPAGGGAGVRPGWHLSGLASVRRGRLPWTAASPSPRQALRSHLSAPGE